MVAAGAVTRDLTSGRWYAQRSAELDSAYLAGHVSGKSSDDLSDAVIGVRKRARARTCRRAGRRVEKLGRCRFVVRHGFS